jgi:phosphoribosylformylglycinamidine cyclo-ligase
MDKHDTVGIDCVAMCVNDVVCQGAKPLLFLDYIATGKLEPGKAATIVRGMAEGCLQAGCALIGGETAEMPGFYSEGEYDLAGFCVGLVQRSKAINGSTIGEGDVLIGLASSGVHSNGYSLVRKLFDVEKDYNKYYDELGCTLGEELLKPTRIYVKNVLSLINQYNIKGVAHITGGGFIENIPRMLPKGMTAEIQLGSWEVPPIFSLMQNLGQLEDRQIYNTFNMGIGMVLAVNAADADEILASANAMGEKAYIIGKVSCKEDGVVLCK